VKKESYMRERMAWNPALALTGLAALVVYILACTSFSPDDSKVLYPTIDPQTGAIGVAVYDRTSRQSELLFVPRAEDLSSQADRESLVLRPQWLADGRRILVAWFAKDQGESRSDDALSLALLPSDRKGPTRLFHLEDLSDRVAHFFLALPVAGNFLFVAGRSNVVIRLDLANGEVRRSTVPPDTSFLPSESGDVVMYMTKTKEDNDQLEFGSMRPDTFARTAIGKVRIDPAGSNPILSRDSKRVAYVAQDGERPVLRLVEPGKPDRTLPLQSLSAKTKLGNAQFSPKGDVLYAAFMEVHGGEPGASFGFVETPVGGGPVLKTTLLRSAATFEESDVFLFPIDISHDGKTLAATSTYLALDHAVPDADRALFLVDLTQPERKTTRVPVPARPRQ
jgi:hypothetical protein